jgi:hypothetical protein
MSVGAPVSIVGMPRSGTSLSEQILASHPAIFGAGELTFGVAHSPLIERPNSTAVPPAHRPLRTAFRASPAAISIV